MQLVCFKVPVSLTKVPSSVTKCNHDLPLPIQRAKGLIVEKKALLQKLQGGLGEGGGGTLHHMHVLLTQKAQCARMETKVGFWSLLLFKTDKSKRMESLTIFKHICQLWCFPLLYRIPGPSERVCVLARQSVLGLAAQGACLNRLWLTHTC